jgi:two-component system heavy metal sensor histidine kinase CusS
MPLSRLRLRLAVRFALAFLGGLVLLDVALYSYLRVQADRRLNRHLEEAAIELAAAVRSELIESPERGLAFAAPEAITEWRREGGGYLVLTPDGESLAARIPPAWLTYVTGLPLDREVVDVDAGERSPVRRVLFRNVIGPPFVTAALGSTEGVVEERRALAVWLLLSAPLVLMVSLAGGYLLSRGALAPIRELEQAIAGITPDRLQARLGVHALPDELDRVALQFNALLERLGQARAENRRFLRQAAHQIRTPLTLVVGEATLMPTHGASTEELQAAFRRIRLAAEQMQRRVGELFLLAEAQAGEPLELSETIELDALALECADAMRGRARMLDRRLQLGGVRPVTIRGNAVALREAVLELLENGVRHGTGGGVVQIEVTEAEGAACVTVSSAGPPVSPRGAGAGAEHGLGLSIVRWIAEQHHGRLEYQSESGRNIFVLTLPDAVAADSTRAVNANPIDTDEF